MTSSSNCVIIGCSAAAHGGGITFDSGGTVTGSRIEQCSSGQGGGIFMNHGGLLDRCAVRKNQGTTGGGFYCYYGGDVHNSLITGNTASGGGGASCDHGGMFENCTVTGNSGTNGGGGLNFYLGGTSVNCIVYFNVAGSSGSNWNANAGSFAFVCTTPTNGLNAYGGAGCITNDPRFVGGSDYHLQAGSPCIDKGNNAFMASGFDLDGTPRPLDGDANGTAIVDIGCYEYLNSSADSNGDGIPDGWAIAHGLNPTVPGDATNNPDGDGFNNLQEYIADTNPTNAASYFHIISVSNLPPWTVSFGSSSNRLYTLYSRTNLAVGGWLAVPGQSNVVGTGGRMSLSDTNAAAVRCYRVQVRLP